MKTALTMYKSTIFLLVLSSVDFSKSHYFDEPVEEHPQPTPFQDWDYLVYSQRWPVTACTTWEEKSKINKCSLPQDTNTWTVHGIWPTKIGENGPFFCDSAIHFDMNQLAPMLTDLEEYWVNVEANTKLNSFWKHEWDKHGTCASVLPQLNSVTNFFKKGLSLNKQFEISDILSKGNIRPNVDGYKIEDIYQAVKGFTGKNPMVQCDVDSKTKESLISEIRICLNKSLDVIDCDIAKSNGSYNDLITNCNLKKPVMYYGKVPNNTVISYDRFYSQHCKANDSYGKIFNLYQVIKFIIWFTL